MSLLDTIKGSGLKAAVSLIEMLLPPAKPLAEAITQDIADGKVTIDNFEQTFDAGLTTVEEFTNDKWDAAIEQYKVVAREAIKAEQLTEAAIKG